MLEVYRFIFNPFQENSYVLIDDTKTCAIVDPGNYSEDENRRLKAFITENGLNPKMILLTHGHFDHICGISFLTDTFGLPVYAHAKAQKMINEAPEHGAAFGITLMQPPVINYKIEDGEELFIGNSELKVIHLPGHSEGSVFFYNVENKIAVVGDILFNGSIGRTDLPGGNLDDLLTGIHKKLLVLPEDTQIFPGHGPETSIGIEAKTNPFLDNQVL